MKMVLTFRKNILDVYGSVSSGRVIPGGDAEPEAEGTFLEGNFHHLPDLPGVVRVHSRRDLCAGGHFC